MSPAKHPWSNSQSVESFLAAQLGEVSSRLKGVDVHILEADGCYRIHAYAGRRDLIIASGNTEPSAVNQACMRIHQKRLRGFYGREQAEANAFVAIAQPPHRTSQSVAVTPATRRRAGSGQTVAASKPSLHERQTVAINATQIFWDAVEASPGRNREDRMRRLLKRGLAEIERRLDFEAADGVFADIEAACQVFMLGRKRQLMLRLDSAVYNHVVVAAYAKRVRPAAFCVECIAYALADIDRA